MAKSWLWLALGLAACSGSGANTAGSGGSEAVGGGSANGGALNGGTSGAGSGSGGTSSAGKSSGAGTSNAAGSSSGGASDMFTAIPVNAPRQVRGELSIAQYSADATNFETNVDIYFTDVRGQWDGCTRYQLGDCGYYDCPAGSVPVGTANNLPPIYYDGGTATITGMPPAVVATFDTGNGQLFARPMQQLWPTSGGSISIAVTGGSTVPAFTMQLPTPPLVRLLNVNGQASPTSIKRSDGIKLTWISQGPGTVAFFVYALSGGEHPAAVCQFDAAATEGELPAAVLTHVDPGATYYLEFRGQATQDMQVSGWDMSGYASSYGSALENSTTTAITLE